MLESTGSRNVSIGGRPSACGAEMSNDYRPRTNQDIKTTGATGISTYTLTSGPSRLHTQQWGEAFYQPTDNSSISFGDTTDVFESNSILGHYKRSVRAVNGSVVSDTDDRDDQPSKSNDYSDHSSFLK